MGRAWDSLLAGMASWHQAKLFVEHSVAIDHDTLHLMAGLVLWLAVTGLARRSVSSWLPWLIVLGFALVNELADLSLELWPDPGRQYGEGAKDLFLTMFVPSVLLIAARLNPRLFAPSSTRRARR